MDTIITDKSGIPQAARCLASGGLVVFPTETVYGLGGNAFDENAIDNIYKAKGRPSDNPLIVHIADMTALDDLAEYVPDYAWQLIDKYWPGPMTLVFKKKPQVISRVTAGMDTVAVRYPSNTIAQQLIRESGVYVAAPSANLSGSPSPTTAKHVIDDLYGRVDYIIDGDGCEVGLESTVIDASGEHPVILRPGAVTIEMIKCVDPMASADKCTVSAQEKPKCPGMKYTHYSPRAEVVVVCGEKKKRAEYISRKLAECTDCGVLTYKGGDYNNAAYVADAGDNMVEYAQRLFACLRQFDEQGVGTVYAEFCIEGGIGEAVKNRLYKAAGYNVIDV